MLKLLKQFQDKLETISLIDIVKPYTKEKEIMGASYAVTIEIGDSDNYKERKNKFEDLIFINCYCNDRKNGDNGVLHLRSKVISLFDEAAENLTNTKIKVYMCKYKGSLPKPEFNEKLQMWQTVVTFKIRWSEL